MPLTFRHFSDVAVTSEDRKAFGDRDIQIPGRVISLSLLS